MSCQCGHPSAVHRSSGECWLCRCTSYTELEGGASARHDDPVTSKEARDRCDPTALEEKTLQVMRPGVDWTCREIVDASEDSLTYDRVTPRMKRLRIKGLIELVLDEEGEPVKREHQQVYRVTAAGGAPERTVPPR